MIDVGSTAFRSMFREYDLRGRVSEEELNMESVQRVAHAFGILLKKRKIRRGNKTALEYDSLAEAWAAWLAAKVRNRNWLISDGEQLDAE